MSRPESSNLLPTACTHLNFDTRRSFMRMGLAGFTSLSLPGIMRLQAASPLADSSRKKTAVILVWKPGGCSHIDTYDPKPEATSEYRGPFGVIKTKVNGLHFTELLPKQASIADKFVIHRGMYQGAGGHPAGSMQMFSGDTDTRDKPKPRLPDWMAVTNYLRSLDGPRDNPLPAYVGINPPHRVQRSRLSRRCLFTVLGHWRSQFT